MSGPDTTEALSEPSSHREAAVVAERSPWWPEALTLALLGIGSLIVLLYFLREPVMSDDLTYWRFSSAWLEGREPSFPNHHRFAFLLSVYLGKVMLGPTLASYHTVALAYAVGLVLALYALTRLFFPRAVALTAAGLLATSPVFLEDATVLVPDWPVMFWVVAGTALMVLAACQREPRWSMLAGLGGGAAFFLALSVKEQVAPLLPILAVCVVLGMGWRHAWRPLAAAAVTGLVLVAGELVLLASLYGEPLHRLNSWTGGHLQSVSGGGESWVERGLVEADLTWADLGIRYLEVIGSTTSGRIMLALAAMALVVALVTGSRRVLFFAVPAVFGWGFVAFTVGSVDPLIPLLRTKVRYLAMGWVFAMPLISSGAWTVGRGTTHLVGRRLGGVRGREGAVASVAVLAGAGVIGAIGVADAREMPNFIRTGADGLHRTMEVIETSQERGQPLDRFLTDVRTATALRMALPRDERDMVATFNLAKRERVETPGALDEDDLVVVNRKRIDTDGRRHATGGVPKFFLIPPLHWRQVDSSEFADFRIYRVTDRSGEVMARSLGQSDSRLLKRFHGYIYGENAGTMDKSPNDDGVRFRLRNAEDARVLLGAGPDHRPPEGRDAQRLAVPETGRLGVQLWLHVPARVEVKAAWLRIYDADGVVRRERLRRAADGRGDENAVSYAGSLDVEPDANETFRVLVVLEGTGEVTVDRVAPVLKVRE